MSGLIPSTKLPLSTELLENPFPTLFLVNLPANSPLVGKAQYLKEFSVVLSNLETLTEDTFNRNHWGSIASGFSAAITIAGSASLVPVVGWILSGVSVVAAAASIGGAIHTKSKVSPVIETLKRHRLALESQEANQWAALWELAGTDLFCRSLGYASRGVVSGGKLNQPGTDSPFMRAVDFIAECRGMGYEQVIVGAGAIKNGTKSAPLPEQKPENLPSPSIGQNTKLLAIEAEAKPVEENSIFNLEPAPQFNCQTLLELAPKERAIAILTQLSKDGFDLSRCIAEQITCICGNQRGGKGTLMAILAILSCAIDPITKIHYFTAGDDIYPFKCDRLVCRLSYPKLDGDKADLMVAQALYEYLKAMDNQTQGACKDIILVIDEAVALSDYLDPDQKQWMIRFLLTRANKKGAQVFIVLHGKSLTSWVGTGNTGGFSQTFKTGATFIGCEATSKKINPLRSISVATGHYFLTDPDDFSKPVGGGDLGYLPEWLKREINPATSQPDPARTLLKFFPELHSTHQVVTPVIDTHFPSDQQNWDRFILESDNDQINELIDQRRSKSKSSSPIDEAGQLQTIDEQIAYAVEAIEEYLEEKGTASDTARNIYNGKNRLKKVAKTMNDFKDLLEVASEMGLVSYFNDGNSTRVSLIK